MFFARVRWVGKVLDGAGIDTNSEPGRELSSVLITFSKICQEKNRCGDGAGGVHLDLGPAEWALFAAIFAPEEPRVTKHLTSTPGLSDVETSSLLARVRKAALELAKTKMPDVLATITGGQSFPSC
jgi:hypothetical protein